MCSARLTAYSSAAVSARATAGVTAGTTAGAAAAGIRGMSAASGMAFRASVRTENFASGVTGGVSTRRSALS